MATSLARQLQQLQIPVTLFSAAASVTQKKASFLFDAKDAADIDNETVFSIGVNGLEELIAIEPAFSTFENLLFSESSKSLERTLQSKEWNEKLDKHIDKFLTHLSPYFMLKPSHKTLEWLIRRFQIHVFNVDSLMTCVLPYHETNLFVRVVQILPLKGPSSKWHWLRPIQEASKPLSKTAFLQHCISDVSFLSLICNMVSDSKQLEIPPSSSRVLYSFYTATVVGILDMMPTVTEKFLTHLLPYLLENLKSHLSELQASSYMIIAQLCLKCRMEEKLIKSFLENICKNLKPQLVVEGLCCIIYLCQSQDVKELSKRTMKALLKVSGLVEIFHHVSSTHIMTPLLDIFVPQLVTTGLKNALTEEPDNSDMNSLLDIAQQMIRDIEFEKSSIVILTRTLLEEYCHLRDIHNSNKNGISRLNTKVKVLMEALQKRYPTELEKAIELHVDFIKETADSSEGGINQEALKWTMELISFTLTMVKSQVIPDSSTTLFLSLHHPHAQVREMAVKHLGELLRGKEKLSEDKEFITEALLSRLHDDNPIIVSCVLKLGQMLASNLPAPRFVEEMLNILKKKSLEWEEVQNEALLLLVGDWIDSADCSLVDRIVFGLLPFLVLNQRSKAVAIPMLRTISGSVLASKHVLLHGMKNFVKRKDLESCEINSDPKILAFTNGLFFHWLGQNLLKLDDQNIIKVVQDMIIYAKSCIEESTFQVMLKCFLGEAVCMITSQCKMQLCQAVTEYILPDLWEVTRMQGNYQLPWDELAVDREQGCKVPITLLESLTNFLGKKSSKRLDQAKGALTLWLSGILIKTLPATTDAACGKWWIPKDDSKLVMLLFEVISFGSGVQTLYQEQFKELLKNLLEFHLSDKLIMLKFLRHQWCKPPQRDNKSASYLLQVQCLHIANTYLTSASEKNEKELLKITSIVVPALLVPVVSPVTAVRKSAMTCITSVKTCMSSAQGGHIDALLSALVDNAEELIADPDQLSRVLGEYFSPLMSPCKPKLKVSGEVKIIKNSLNYMLLSVTCSETPTYIRRIILSSLRKVVTQDMVMKLLPVLEQLLKKCENDSVLLEDEILLLQLIVEKYTPQTANLLQLGSPFWEMLERVLQQRTSVCIGHLSPMITALGQITDRFFQAITGEELQIHLLTILVDSLLETRDVRAGNAVKTTISSICLKADMVIKELVKFNPKKESKLKKRKVKRIQSENQDQSSEVSHHLKRTTAILELLQHKINVEEPHVLLPTLFAILARCVELDHSQAASEYIMQLVFSLINRICQNLSLNSTSGLSGLVPEDQFDVELIIQCIRSSESPQTHNQALLLLATAANLFPEKVLHNVMSIFTFMGASVMRQDDSYSFEVISKTLDTVIPALIQAGKKEQLPQFAQKSISSLDNVVTMLIRVFVDASPHIPEHRKLPLFTHLINTVGPDQFLHTAVLLVLEKHVVCAPNNSDDHKQAGLKNPLGAEFCLSLCHSFDSNVQVKVILKLLQYIDSLPCEKLEVSQKPKMSQKTATSFLNVIPVFDVNVHSAKQLRQFIYTSLSIIPSLLDIGHFSSKVHDEMLNSLFLRLLEDTLTFMAKTAQRTEQAPRDVTGKFLKALLNKAYEIVDKINFLLPTSVFFDMIKGLLLSNSGTVRRKAMGLLNSNLGYHSGSYSHDQIESLLNLVTELLAISKAESDAQESIINRQTALYSLKLLSRLLAKDHPSQFKDVMSTTIEVFSSKDANVQVVSSALLCVAEVVGSLKAHAIPFLPQFVPTVIKLIKRSEKDRNSLLALCGVTALSKVTVSLPHFLSPYLVDILFQVTRLSSSEGCDGDNQVGHIELAKQPSIGDQLKERLIFFRKSIAQNVAPRVLIFAVSECYHTVIAKQKEQVATLMILLAECITSMKKDDVKTYQSNLLNLFLEVLDFRIHCSQGEDEKLIDKTEGKVIEAFLCLVVKLSEVLFRPMFFRLIDWATRPVSPKERLLVFYRLCDSVAEKLKSLFVLFAGYILKNCASVLEATNFSKTGESIFPEMCEDKGAKLTSLLLNYLLGCLHKCFMYGTHGFLDNDHFHCLMQPLVDQIDNRLGGDAEFKERISRCLAPTLAQFAVAAGNDAQWKPLNYQVLLKTRDKSSVVRFGALKVLEAFHARLGEDFMVLLPETIPYLAELMEDESFEVEQQCQHVISEMERVLGEPLQKYF